MTIGNAIALCIVIGWAAFATGAALAIVWLANKDGG